MSSFPTNRTRRLLAGVAVLGAAGLALSACSTSSAPAQQQTVTTQPSHPSSSAGTAPTTAPSTAKRHRPRKPAKRVHVSVLNNPGETYGVGMPVIAYFSRRITDASTIDRDTTATVNGKRVHGAWDFETSAAGHGPIEGHYRLRHYWPAHSRIFVKIGVKGKSAGKRLVYGNTITLGFKTGPANIAVVNDATHTLTLTSDGRKIGSYPVSLGDPSTPTQSGTKVVMEQGRDISMSGTLNSGVPYYDGNVFFTQRLTYSGEYLHAAPWNTAHIAEGVDSSNGCTNLTTEDAHKLFDFMRIGDVVQYPNAAGPQMQFGEGYGDWNVPWAQWRTGGIVSS